MIKISIKSVCKVLVISLGYVSRSLGTEARVTRTLKVGGGNGSDFSVS